MSEPRQSRSRGDDARLIDAAARERLSVAAADLSIPDALRLTDWQRTTLSALGRKLARTIEDELRTNLLPMIDPARKELLAALSSAHVPLALPLLERSGLLLDELFVAALFRRAEEHRRYRGSSQTELLVDLMRDADDLISQQAMAIVIAQSRRFDRFAEPVAARTELPAEIEHALVWRVAAALRTYMADQHDLAPEDCDAAAASAAEQLLAGYDEGDSLEAHALRLARLLDERDRLTDDIIHAALEEGMLPVAIAGLSVRTSLGYAAAWEVLSDPRGRGAVLLLKAAGMDRSPAAAILLQLATSDDAAGRQLDLFDVTSTSEAVASLRLWRTDRAFRDAIADLSARTAA